MYQAGKWLNEPSHLSSFFFSQVSTIMPQAITMILTQEVAFSTGYCTHTQALAKKSKLFSSDSLATLKWTLAIPRHFVIYVTGSSSMHMRTRSCGFGLVSLLLCERNSKLDY